MREIENIRRLEFHISYQCINNCLFCSEKDQLKKFRGQFVEKVDIEKKIKQFSGRGFNHLTFTGGEPTLHPNFVELVKLTKRLNYKTYVSSNGGLFSSKRFCQKVLPYLDEICFSLHGHNAQLHNLHTRNNRSFNRLIRALNNIEKSPENIYGFINIVMTKYNFDFLEKIIEFVSCYKWIKQILISNLAPEGDGLANFEKLAIPLNQIEKKVGGLINLVQKKSLNIRFFGLPLCLMGSYWTFSNDVFWTPRATIEKWQNKREIYLKTTFSYQPIRKRIKSTKCRKCQTRKICGGIFQKYLQIFGDQELKPF